MRVIYYGRDKWPAFTGPVVTVGSFDGVHRGHKALLKATVYEALARGAESVAVTLWPHPRKVLKNGERTWLLSPIGEKLRLLSDAGIGTTVVIPFDEAFAKTGSREFIEDFIIGKLDAAALVVGYDHRFGRDKDGDFALLEEYTRKGLGVMRVGEQTGDGLKISSTEVRRAVSEGDMPRAARILGHNYFVWGTIGERRPETASPVGFIPDDADKLMPPDGTYPVKESVRSAGTAGGSGECKGNLKIEKGACILESDLRIESGCGAELEFL